MTTKCKINEISRANYLLLCEKALKIQFLPPPLSPPLSLSLSLRFLESRDDEMRHKDQREAFKTNSCMHDKITRRSAHPIGRHTSMGSRANTPQHALMGPMGIMP
jgi:hypothetical protein